MSGKNLPEGVDPEPRNGGSGNNLFINELNYHANDLSELRRLAEINPDLAHKIVDDGAKRAHRSETSYRLALGVAGSIALALVIGGAYVLINIGPWQTLIFVALLLGISHVVRSVLKGEFSDTSWFGQILGGSKKPDD